MHVCIIRLTNRFVTLTIHILYTMRATQCVHRSVARQWRLIYDLLDPMHASPFIYRLCKCIVLCTPLYNTRRSARSSLPSSFYLEELIAIFSFSFRHHDGKLYILVYKMLERIFATSYTCSELWRRVAGHHVVSTNSLCHVINEIQNGNLNQLNFTVMIEDILSNFRWRYLP